MNKSNDTVACKWVQDHIVQYEDGQLDSDLERQVAAHLQNCPQCTAEADAFSELNEVLHQLPEIQVSSGFASVVVAKARRRSVAPRTISLADWWPSVTIGWRMATIAGVSAALLAGFALGTTLLNHQQPSVPLLHFFGNGHASLTDTYQELVTGQTRR